MKQRKLIQKVKSFLAGVIVAAMAVTIELWFADDSKLASALANIEYQYTSDYTVRGGAFEALQNVEFKENASKFAVQIMNGSTLVGTTYFQQINSCVQLGINYSELVPEGYVYSNPDYKQQVEAAIASTNGMSVVYRSNTPQVLYEHIVAHTASPQTEFDAIVPTGWKHIVLDGVLDPDNGVNSDTDELTDWEEIDTERIRWEEGGTIILPTIQECIDFVEKPYAKEGLARFKTTKQVPGMPSSDFYKYLDYVLNSTRILPIFSDPTAEDSDGDGWADHEDSSPLKVNTNLDEEMSQALIDALNDYLNQIMPPVYNENGEKITSKNRKCVATWNHFNEYIWPVLVENGTRPEGRLAAYTAWLREAYGLYGAEKFWLTLDGYVDTFYYELVNFEETIDRAVNQIIFGNYSEDVSLTGTAGQVTLSFLGVDFVADIRDITYDIDHWEFTWKHAGQTACDMVALLPVIGTLKHSDEFTSLAKVSKAKSVEYLDEFTVTANQMSLLGKNYDEITTAGKIALRSKKIELVTEQISTIANKYDNFKCVECAGDIRKFLKNNGEEFEVLDIDLKKVENYSIASGVIWSDKKGMNISTNGFHTGTLYNGKVYDNIYSEGVLLEDWLSDFQVILENGSVDLWQLYKAGVFKFK